MTPKELEEKLAASEKENARFKELNEKLIAEKKETALENKALSKELKEAGKKISKATGIVPGTFKDEETGLEYRFKKGVLKFIFGKVEHHSEEALKDAELMASLVEKKSGVIELVEVSK